MTKSIQELFAYISSAKFNPEIFRHDLRNIKDLDVNIKIGEGRSTFLGEAARVLNVSAVEILLKDFHASPDSLTKGEGQQVWTPVYWTVYNSDKSTIVDAIKRLEILDFLREAGATMNPLIKRSDYAVSCNPLISYAKGSMTQDLLFHGISPQSLDRRNVGEGRITQDTSAILSSLTLNIEKNPAEYLYITAIHSLVRLPVNAKANALDALKNGAAPKIGATYTTIAKELLEEITQEFVQDPSAFLKSSLHVESLSFIEQYLINHGSDNLETIAGRAYESLIHQAIDPHIEGGYTDNTYQAIARLAAELDNNSTLLLYCALDTNITKILTSKLQELGTTLKVVCDKARKSLENGASPKVEGVDEYTQNAASALAKIAFNIKSDPMKFLAMTLHDDSKSEISRWLEKNEFSIGIIKDKINESLKHGAALIGYNGAELTTNALEAIARLAEELQSDPKIWLHISLSEDVIIPLSEALAQSGSSLDAIKNAAVDMLKNGENPQTERAYTDNAFEALTTLKLALLKDATQWLYITLEKHAEQKLEFLGLDLEAIKAQAKNHLAHGGDPKTPSALVMTPNAVLLITEIASQYIASKSVPRDTFFHKDVLDNIGLQFAQSGLQGLAEELQTFADQQVSDAINETVVVGYSIVSTKVTTQDDPPSGGLFTWYETIFGKTATPKPTTVSTGHKEDGAVHRDVNISTPTHIDSAPTLVGAIDEALHDNA